VPYSTTIGLHDLVIPIINNATIHYDVRETLLSETPEVTMAPFLVNLNSFSQALGTSPEALAIQNSIDSFNAVYDNANLADKTQMSILYKANKALFDNIILNDFSTVTGRELTTSDIVLLAKHSAAVWLMAAGAIVAIAEPTKIGVAVGSILVAVGAYKAYEYFNQLSNENLNTDILGCNGILGNNNRNTNNTFLTFQNDVTSSVTLNTMERGLITSDASKTLPGVVSFFEDYNGYNYYINKLNGIITWVNNNIIFADFSLISLEQLPTSSPQVSQIANQNIFNNITFNVTHPNLTLVSASLQSDGQMNIKIKITGSPASLPVESFLNYSYSDEFSTFSGKLPIKVQNDPLGKWYVATYTFGPLNFGTDSAPVWTTCGGQSGQSGNVYIYMNNENTQLVSYFKSIISDIPSYYSKMFMNRPYPFFYQETSVNYNLGPDPNNTSSQMQKHINLGGFTSDDNWNTIRSTNMQVGGITMKSTPYGTGCGPNGTLEFGYSFPMNFQYIGTTPPNELTNVNLTQIYNLMTSPGYLNVIE